MTVIVLTYIAGFFISSVVYRVRAGAPAFARLEIFGPTGFGLGWLIVQVAKMFAWPGVLVYWLVNGRPEPATLFNEKAAAARQVQARHNN